MLLCWDRTHETLCGVYIVNANHVVICSDCHVITSRMKWETTNRLAILNMRKKKKEQQFYVEICAQTRVAFAFSIYRKHFVSFLHRCFWNIKQFDGAVSWSWCQNRFLWMKFKERHFVRVIVQRTNNRMTLLLATARFGFIRCRFGEHTFNI